MTFTDWLRDSQTRMNNLGLWRGLSASINEFWVGGLRRLGHHWNYGERIYEREWDVLIILDACRVDLLREVARESEYTFIDPSFEIFTSVGSMSAEWMTKNFDPDERKTLQTAYVSGNPFTRDLDPDRFVLLDEVWRYGWDDKFGGIKPRPVTDRAIAAGRETDADRLLVHYLQPHVPFRSLQDVAIDWGNPEKNFGVKDGVAGDERGPWQQYRDGDLSRKHLWDAYRDNLEWVLADVEILLSNLDAKTVVITADHANAIGEWWCYGHPDYVPIPALKKVPWVVTSATDEQTYEPTLDTPTRENEKMDINERLAALGYK